MLKKITGVLGAIVIALGVSSVSLAHGGGGSHEGGGGHPNVEHGPVGGGPHWGPPDRHDGWDHHDGGGWRDHGQGDHRWDHVRHMHGGVWYEYGVGPCWTWTLWPTLGWQWTCGDDD